MACQPADRNLLPVLAAVLAAAVMIASAGAAEGPASGSYPSPPAASDSPRVSTSLPQPAATHPVAEASRPRPNDRVAGITLPDVLDVVAFRRQQDPAPVDPPARRDGSFGRWLKRHWWVPALVGAAVVATAGESLYDDDGDEDDED